MSKEVKLKQKSINLKDLNKGDVMSQIQYYTFVQKDNKWCHFVTEGGMKIKMTHDIVENNCVTADQFRETVEMTGTELAAKFTEIGNSVFTVNFFKQKKDADIRTEINNKVMEIVSAYQESKADEKVIKRINKDIQKIAVGSKKGEERTLIGYKTGVDLQAGRTIAQDLEKVFTGKSYAVVQVDHRKINWFIYENVKYIKK